MAGIQHNIIEQLSQLSCESVAERLGLEVRRHKALCFMHDDKHPSLAFLGKNKENWRCFVCNKGGDAINLVTEYSDLNFVEACRWLCKEFGIQINDDESKYIRIKKVAKRLRVYDEEDRPFSTNVAKWILNNSTLGDIGSAFLFGKRHLKPSVIDKLGILSVEDSNCLVEGLSKAFDRKTLVESGFVTETKNKLYFRMFAPCLLFPYYDVEGELVGLQSRYLGTSEDAPRFQFVSAQKTRMFNLPILKSLKYGDDLYISEGITDCLALLSSGKNAVAIPSATILPKLDLMKIRTFKLRMYPDQDDAGRNAFLKLREFCINHFASLKEEHLPDGIKDYSDYYISIVDGK